MNPSKTNSVQVTQPPLLLIFYDNYERLDMSWNIRNLGRKGVAKVGPKKVANANVRSSFMSEKID